MRDAEFTRIVEFCEACLDRHGDSYLGVGWTKRQADADTRYRVMLDIVREPVGTPLTLLDFGCGASHLYEYICQQGLGHHLTYSGLDVSPRFLELSRRKFPAVAYLELDVLQPRAEWPTYDYIVLNGIFNVQADLSFDAMWSYARSLLRTVFDHARKGIAFNAMSSGFERRGWQLGVLAAVGARPSAIWRVVGSEPALETTTGPFIASWRRDGGRVGIHGRGR